MRSCHLFLFTLLASLTGTEKPSLFDLEREKPSIKIGQIWKEPEEFRPGKLELTDTSSRTSSFQSSPEFEVSAASRTRISSQTRSKFDDSSSLVTSAEVQERPTYLSFAVRKKNDDVVGSSQTWKDSGQPSAIFERGKDTTHRNNPTSIQDILTSVERERQSRPRTPGPIYTKPYRRKDIRRHREKNDAPVIITAHGESFSEEFSSSPSYSTNHSNQPDSLERRYSHLSVFPERSHTGPTKDRQQYDQFPPFDLSPGTNEKASPRQQEFESENTQRHRNYDDDDSQRQGDHEYGGPSQRPRDFDHDQRKDVRNSYDEVLEGSKATPHRRDQKKNRGRGRRKEVIVENQDDGGYIYLTVNQVKGNPEGDDKVTGDGGPSSEAKTNPGQLYLSDQDAHDENIPPEIRKILAQIPPALLGGRKFHYSPEEDTLAGRRNPETSILSPPPPQPQAAPAALQGPPVFQVVPATQTFGTSDQSRPAQSPVQGSSTFLVAAAGQAVPGAIGGTNQPQVVQLLQQAPAAQSFVLQQPVQQQPSAVQGQVITTNAGSFILVPLPTENTQRAPPAPPPSTSTTTTTPAPPPLRPAKPHVVVISPEDYGELNLGGTQVKIPNTHRREDVSHSEENWKGLTHVKYPSKKIQIKVPASALKGKKEFTAHATVKGPTVIVYTDPRVVGGHPGTPQSGYSNTVPFNLDDAADGRTISFSRKGENGKRIHYHFHIGGNGTRDGEVGAQSSPVGPPASISDSVFGFSDRDGPPGPPIIGPPAPPIGSPAPQIDNIPLPVVGPPAPPTPAPTVGPPAPIGPPAPPMSVIPPTAGQTGPSSYGSYGSYSTQVRQQQTFQSPTLVSAVVPAAPQQTVIQQFPSQIVGSPFSVASVPQATSSFAVAAVPQSTFSLAAPQATSNFAFTNPLQTFAAQTQYAQAVPTQYGQTAPAQYGQASSYGQYNRPQYKGSMKGYGSYKKRKPPQMNPPILSAPPPVQLPAVLTIEGPLEAAPPAPPLHVHHFTKKEKEKKKQHHGSHHGNRWFFG